MKQRNSVSGNDSERPRALTLVARITPFADHVTQTPRRPGMPRRSSATATPVRPYIVYVVTRDPLRRGHRVQRSNRDLLRFATVCKSTTADSDLQRMLSPNPLALAASKASGWPQDARFEVGRSKKTSVWTAVRGSAEPAFSISAGNQESLKRVLLRNATICKSTNEIPGKMLNDDMLHHRHQATDEHQQKCDRQSLSGAIQPPIMAAPPTIRARCQP